MMAARRGKQTKGQKPPRPRQGGPSEVARERLAETGHSNEITTWLFSLTAVAIVIGAGALRYYASRGDFWLDEIWTWGIASKLQSARQILTSVHSENNHYLNTWLVWMIGTNAPWTLYRIPAVLAGVATVVMAGLIARGRTESLFAMLLTGSAYLLVHYSSEARGYAYVILFSAVAFWLLDRSFQRQRTLRELLFSVACVFGFLSQPMFIYFYVSAGVWAFWRWWRSRLSWTTLIRHAACAFLLPTVCAIGLWIVDLSRTENAGGPIYSLRDVLVETASRTVGGPSADAVAGLVALFVAAAFVAGLAGLRRSADDRWLFYLLVCLLIPGVLLVSLQRSFVYVRYFLIVVFFAVLLLSTLLARFFRAGGARRILAVVVVAAMLVGNGLHLQRLLRDGRGQYVKALELINTMTTGPEIIVSSDHDFRNTLVLSYYQSRISNLKPLRYIGMREWPPKGPEWVLRHDLNERYDPPAGFQGRNGVFYRLVRVYPYAGLSGWNWAVYQRLG